MLNNAKKNNNWWIETTSDRCWCYRPSGKKNWNVQTKIKTNSFKSGEWMAGFYRGKNCWLEEVYFVLPAQLMALHWQCKSESIKVATHKKLFMFKALRLVDFQRDVIIFYGVSFNCKFINAYINRDQHHLIHGAYFNRYFNMPFLFLTLSLPIENSSSYDLWNSS